MSKQKHDSGVKKRRLAEALQQPGSDPDDTDALALDLVQRGLCSPRILDTERRPR